MFFIHLILILKIQSFFLNLGSHAVFGGYDKVRLVRIARRHVLLQENIIQCITTLPFPIL